MIARINVPYNLKRNLINPYSRPKRICCFSMNICTSTRNKVNNKMKAVILYLSNLYVDYGITSIWLELGWKGFKMMPVWYEFLILEITWIWTSQRQSNGLWSVMYMRERLHFELRVCLLVVVQVIWGSKDGSYFKWLLVWNNCERVQPAQRQINHNTSPRWSFGRKYHTNYRMVDTLIILVHLNICFHFQSPLS